MPETLLGTIVVNGEDIALIEAMYADGRPAIICRDADGLPYSTLSVNPGPEIALPARCVAIKGWSENADLAVAAAASGLFELTGQEIALQHVTAPIWRIKEQAG